jgi:mono/diheme cytochrome c family protein
LRWLVFVVALIAILGVGLWLLSAPRPLDAASLPDHASDPENGERLFRAAGCASCHAAENAGDEAGDEGAGPLLAGGRMLESPVGTFAVPNISPHPEAGTGEWSTVDMVNAIVRGISPEGSHYFPSFPWTSYRYMRIEDAMDIAAYIETLPESDNEVEPSDIRFPFNIRRGIGLWKRVAMSGEPPEPRETSDQIARGEYLVVALGHCGQCHTPRNELQALDIDRWLAGGPNPEGDGSVPNITPSEDGIGGWAQADIAYLLETGFTPAFDSVGGNMAEVVDNWALVPAQDRQAVAAYLKAVEPRPSEAEE